MSSATPTTGVTASPVASGLLVDHQAAVSAAIHHMSHAGREHQQHERPAAAEAESP